MIKNAFCVLGKLLNRFSLPLSMSLLSVISFISCTGFVGQSYPSTYLVPVIGAKQLNNFLSITTAVIILGIGMLVRKIIISRREKVAIRVVDLVILGITVLGLIALGATFTLFIAAPKVYGTILR